MGLFRLDPEESDESDSAVFEGEEEIVCSRRPISEPSRPISEPSTNTSLVKAMEMQKTSHNEDKVADDVEDEKEDEEDEEDEIPLRRPSFLKTTQAIAASTKPKDVASTKPKDVAMCGNFTRKSSWMMVQDSNIPCTLSYDCILEARHAGICMCPYDESKSRACKRKLTSFAPPPKRVSKTKNNPVVLTAVEIPDTPSAPQVEISSSDDEDRVVASLVSFKERATTSSSSVMTVCTESTGASSAGPSIVKTTQDSSIKELAELLVSLPEENSDIELKLMNAIARKHHL